MRKMLVIIGTCSLLFSACRSQSSAPAPSEKWIMTSGLLGLDISYPEYFSLQKNIPGSINSVTLTNNRSQLEQIKIEPFDAEVLDLCAKDKFPADLRAAYDASPDMKEVAMEVENANAQNTYIEPIAYAKAEDGDRAFVAYGRALTPCGSLTAAKTNVILLPRGIGLYVISYPSDTPILDEIANRLVVRPQE